MNGFVADLTVPIKLRAQFGGIHEQVRAIAKRLCDIQRDFPLRELTGYRTNAS